MSTNIVNDFQSEFNTISRILNLIESYLVKSNNDIKAELCKKLYDHLKANGDHSVHMKMFHKKHGIEIEKRLQAYKLPYTTFEDEKGNMIFLTRDIDDEQFLKIQNDYFLLQPDFYSQISAETLCQIAKDQQEKQLFTVEMQGPNAADNLDIFKTKLYHHESGIISAKSKHTNTLYIHPNDIYKKNGNDLATTQLRWASERSNEDQTALRIAQARYDANEINLAVLQLEEHNNIAIVDALNESENYMYVENGHVILKSKDNDINDYETKDAIPLPDFRKQEEVQAFKEALTAAGTHINNMRVIDASELGMHLTKSTEDLLKETYESNLHQKINRFQFGKDNLDQNTYSIYPETYHTEKPTYIDLTSKLIPDQDNINTPVVIQNFIKECEQNPFEHFQITIKGREYNSDTYTPEYMYVREVGLTSKQIDEIRQFGREQGIKNFAEAYKIYANGRDLQTENRNQLDKIFCLREAKNSGDINIGGTDIDNKLNKKRPFRPKIQYSDAKVEDITGLEFYNRKIKHRLNQLDKMAHDYVNEIDGYDNFTTADKHKLVLSKIKEYIQEGQLDDLIQGDEKCSERIARPIVENIKTSYLNMINENGKDFIIEKKNIKDILEKEKKEIEYQRNHNKDQEFNFDKDSEKDSDI